MSPSDDGVGHLFGTEHGLEACECDVRGDEEDRGGERNADGSCEMFAAETEYPTCGRADEERYCGENRGQAKRGERWAGEIEEVRHGEGVVADVAVSEQRSDIRNEGKISRLPQAPAQGDGGENAGDGEDCLRARQP